MRKPDGGKPAGDLLLEDSARTIAAVDHRTHYGFGVIVIGNRNGNVRVPGQPWFSADRHGKTADQRKRHPAAAKVAPQLP